MMEKHKLSSHTLINLVILLLLLIAIPLLIIAARKPASKQNPNTRLLFKNYQKAEVYVSDDTGKQLSKTSTPVASYVSYQANSESGKLLLGLNAGTPAESFKLYSGKLTDPAPAVLTELHNSVVVSGHHSVYFSDENHLVLLACASQGPCQLERVSLKDGAKDRIYNTGIKQDNPLFPEAFMLGYDNATSTAYIRTNAQNSLGQTKSAVYSIVLGAQKAKLLAAVPAAAGYSLSLSPDNQQLAYQMLENGQSKLHVITFGKQKEQVAALSLGLLANSPASLKWSPDSNKVLVHNEPINLPAGTKAPVQAIKIEYVDLSDNNKVVGLQQINDSQYGNLVNVNWLDNETVISEVQKTTSPHNFLNAQSQTATQNIKSKKITKFNAPSGDLDQVYQVKS